MLVSILHFLSHSKKKKKAYEDYKRIQESECEITNTEKWIIYKV